jgi:photosystem II stability/assembly factor-like uncharacterized protein
MISKAVVVIACILSLTWAIAVLGGNFQDVLNTPAIQSPFAMKTLLNGVAVAGKRIVCVGHYGDIVYSDDQGKNWRQASVPLSSDLLSVFFISAQKGWAVGHDGVVLHSSDGGATWVKQLDGRAASQVMAAYYAEHPCRPLRGAGAGRLMKEINRLVKGDLDKAFLDVCFENETTGFIVGSFNLIFWTGDGGKTWEPWLDRTENQGFLHLESIRSVGGDLFIAGEQGLVLKLDRRTGTFRRMKVPYNGSFFGVTGSSTKALVVFGMRGNAFRSVDGGQSWKKVETGVTVGLMGETVTQDRRIVLVSQLGQLIASSDDGASFRLIDAEQDFPAGGVASVGRDKLAVVGILGVQVRELKSQSK